MFPAVITVRQLLSHTAGLGCRFFEADESGQFVNDLRDAAYRSLGDA